MQKNTNGQKKCYVEFCVSKSETFCVITFCLNISKQLVSRKVVDICKLRSFCYAKATGEKETARDLKIIGDGFK